MSEQIMWAVVEPDCGEVMCVGYSENHCWATSETLQGWDRMDAAAVGYRCIRVRVTEVQDG